MVDNVIFLKIYEQSFIREQEEVIGCFLLVNNYKLYDFNNLFIWKRIFIFICVFFK